MKISIGKAAAELGVTRETLRRWESTGKIASSRTPNGHRRYDLFQLRGMIPKKNPEEIGAELVFSLCEQFGTEVVIINSSEDSSFEDDLVQDVLEIITVFSARLYGARSRKNKKLVEALRDAANEI